MAKMKKVWQILTHSGHLKRRPYFIAFLAEVLVDNQKSAVLAHRPGGEVTWNPGFVLLAEHYGFRPRACQPRRPQTKGKDERNVGYVKQNFFQRYRAYDKSQPLCGEIVAIRITLSGELRIIDAQDRIVATHQFTTPPP
jgi:transposase